MLDKMYKLVEQNVHLDLILDHIFDEIDELLGTCKFVECDKILQDVDLSKLDITVMLAFITTTYVAKNVLPSRKELFSRVENELHNSMTEENAKDLMRGLQ